MLLGLVGSEMCIRDRLTSTNRGASAVCRAALAHKGISDDDLLAGYQGDPASKSKLRILCRPGLLYRLTRNLDKRRGFVNGALAVCVESLKGCEVFIVRLVSSGNLVLVHPVEERGQRFFATDVWVRHHRTSRSGRFSGHGLHLLRPEEARSRSGLWLRGCIQVQVERRMFLVGQAATN